MAIGVGEQLPEATFMTLKPEGKQKTTTAEVFKGRRVVLFAVPGAFTPTCHLNHLPGFLTHFDAIRAKGIDDVVCVAVNDIDVLNAWAKHTGAAGKITFLADGNCEFTRKIGLDYDLTAAGMGMRSRRYSMIVDDGKVIRINLEDKPGVNVSGAETILTQL